MSGVRRVTQLRAGCATSARAPRRGATSARAPRRVSVGGTATTRAGSFVDADSSVGTDSSVDADSSVGKKIAQTELLVSRQAAIAGEVVRDYLSRHRGAKPPLLACGVSPGADPTLVLYEDYEQWLQDALERRAAASSFCFTADKYDPSKVLLSVTITVDGCMCYTELQL
jgi:hypothetical protein